MYRAAVYVLYCTSAGLLGSKCKRRYTQNLGSWCGTYRYPVWLAAEVWGRAPLRTRRAAQMQVARLALWFRLLLWVGFLRIREKTLI